MIARIIRWSATNLGLVFILTLLVTAIGLYAVTRVPLDAIPDLSDTPSIPDRRRR
jgi:Cu(I)/Ag(I) efflux system membrane protein CusA/SilA